MFCLGKQPQLDSNFPVWYVLVPVLQSSSACLKGKSWYLLPCIELIRVLRRHMENDAPMSYRARWGSLNAPLQSCVTPGLKQQYMWFWSIRNSSFCRGPIMKNKPRFKVIKRRIQDSPSLPNCWRLWAEKSPKAFPPQKGSSERRWSMKVFSVTKEINVSVKFAQYCWRKREKRRMKMSAGTQWHVVPAWFSVGGL